ncbi:hypothetical protein ACG83_10670 [Frankia sp. R43]|uniref:phage tail tube protein n=1 Tax=Frankia sp. R43 TaxID=269536 RepID=UPI0006CA22AB|nr:hypothetical protein [Frankia sp. R43]KPM55733.1 hypothetical protein ACG83_10670 [Frankia sp. R43]
MPVDVSNLIQGPGTLYRGAFGTAEPSDTQVNATPAPSGWTDVGGTQDGVTMTISQTYSELEVDQVVDIPGRRLTKREATIKTNLAEATLENLATSLNNATATSTGAGFAAWSPPNDTSATQPSYTALIFDGIAPKGYRRRVFVRRTLSVEDVGMAYKKGDQTLLPVTFAAHYVSASVPPFRIVDATA